MALVEDDKDPRVYKGGAGATATVRPVKLVHFNILDGCAGAPARKDAIGA